MDTYALTHFGVLGMKWGVRRTPEQLSRSKGHIDAASDMVKAAKTISNAVSNVRSAAKRKDLSSMSDQELRERESIE
jgi:hypothetical protein